MTYYDMEKMEHLYRLIHKKFIAEWNAVSPLNLTLSQANMLQKLHRESQRVSDLAELLHMTAGGLTLLCDKLEEKGLILRYRDEVDRRSVNLKISEQGEQVVIAIKSMKNGLFQKMIQGVPDEELQAMDKLHTRILRNLEVESC
ncbi:MarR family winged helix-turn-helix transcriptional regulator [Paenibacillus agricola]|nr:MarR family transcriptional regulator [Paenibacillus agricola]